MKDDPIDTYNGFQPEDPPQDVSQTTDSLAEDDDGGD